MTNDARPRPALDADEVEALQAIGWQPAANGSVCPDSSLLLAAEDGVLDDAIADRVRAHVHTCSTCQLLVEDLAAVFAADPAGGEAARIRARIGTGRSARQAQPYLWLGGLVAAAAVAWFLFVPRGSGSPPAPVTELARATPPPVPSLFVVDRPAIPPGDVDLAVRGEATRVSLPNRIAAALDKADAGDLTSASSDLAGLVRAHPASQSAGLALGAVQLRANQNVEALATLERARALKSEPELRDELDWFLGIALVRAGNRDGARARLDGVCKRGGARGAKACAGIAELNR